MKSRLRTKSAGQRDLYGISIAFVVHSLDHSLSIRLIPPYKCTFQQVLNERRCVYAGYSANAATNSPFDRFQTLAIPSRPPAATNAPSALKSTA